MTARRTRSRALVPALALLGSAAFACGTGAENEPPPAAQPSAASQEVARVAEARQSGGTAATKTIPAAAAQTAPATPAERFRQAVAASDNEKLKGDFQTTASGLMKLDLVPGTGEPVAPGDDAVVHYTGWLLDGTQFDSSRDRGRPFTVRNVGRASVIRGWNEGLVGLRQGGERRLVIPAELAYGSRARGKIPADSPLLFDIEVLDVQKPIPAPPKPEPPDVASLKLTSSASGLRWVDLSSGQGRAVQQGDTASVYYTGWLEDGSQFDSAHDRGSSFDVRNVGQAPVILGWNEGLVGVKEGGRRLLVIPSDLAYGPGGRPPVIPPAATLIFVIDVVKVTPG